MKTLTIKPGITNSLAIEDRPAPPAADGAVLVETLAIGVCGTDREIIAGRYGKAPPGRERLVIGHESLGVVLEAPENSGFSKGDHVVAIVRRPDPLPCPACAAGLWDMCFNGNYTERGIKQRDGYAAERFRVEPNYLVKVDRALGVVAVLTEPASIVAKAWEHCDRVRRIPPRTPHRALVTGAGTVGLLAALMAKQRGCEVHVLDRTVGGLKPELVTSLGGHYHNAPVEELANMEFDTILECTGARAVIAALELHAGHNAVICLAGVSSPGHDDAFDLGQSNRLAVLRNLTIFGTVNANHRHYADAVALLGSADPAWLKRLITRTVPLADFPQAFENGPHDIKVVLTFAGASDA